MGKGLNIYKGTIITTHLHIRNLIDLRLHGILGNENRASIILKSSVVEKLDNATAPGTFYEDIGLGKVGEMYDSQ